MSRYTNQAKRVIQHISNQCHLAQEDVGRIYRITQEAIENRIAITCQISKVNAYRAADILIELWERANPDSDIEDIYNIKHIHKGIEFKFRLLQKEILCLFTAQHGSDLYSFHKRKEKLTDKYLTSLCEQALQKHHDKVSRIKA
jgi:hypothetical protein